MHSIIYLLPGYWLRGRFVEGVSPEAVKLAGLLAYMEGHKPPLR